MTRGGRGRGVGRRAAAALAALVVGTAVRAGAQGPVSGRLTLVERPDDARADLAAAVVYLVPAAGGPAIGATAGAPVEASIAMRGREFVPHVQVVAAGGTVAFPNEDPFSHNVFSNTALNAFDLGLYRHHASRSARFDRPGVYPIYCNIHPRMVSYVITVPAAVLARPDATGQFLLPAVPAGAYVLHAWHERAGEVTRPIVVGAAGADDVRLTLDARAYVPAPHLNKFGLPYTAARADRY